MRFPLVVGALVLALGAGCNVDTSGLGLTSSGEAGSTGAQTEPGEGSTSEGTSSGVDGTTQGTEGSSGGEPGCDDPVPWYPDDDGDGFGDPARPMHACEAPPGHVADATDCDDAAEAAHPGADEVCDALDNDCDGRLDEWAEDTNDGECSGCVPRRVGSVVYYACKGDMEWTAGQELCQARGAELTSIADQGENDTIVLLLELVDGYDFAFIGYNDLQTEGTWVWSDGTPSGYEEWATAQPDPVGGDGQDCAVIQPLTGEWYDRPCSNGGLDAGKSDGVVCRDPTLFDEGQI